MGTKYQLVTTRKWTGSGSLEEGAGMDWWSGVVVTLTWGWGFRAAFQQSGGAKKPEGLIPEGLRFAACGVRLRVLLSFRVWCASLQE